MKKLLLTLFISCVIIFNMSFISSEGSTDNDESISVNLIENPQSKINFESGTTWYISWINFTGGILFPRQMSCCCRLPFSYPLGPAFMCTEEEGPSCPL